MSREVLASPSPPHAPRLSVVVPTCGRPALLARCLSALASQSLARDSYEVIVVDDGRQVETRWEVERAACSGVTFTYLEAGPRGGPAAARNIGWRAARGEVIAFTDDDCLPNRGWLQAGLDAIDTGVEGACGQVIVPVPEHPTDYQRDVAGLERAEFVTANCFYRRRALEAVGGFDPRFRVAWREDSDLFFRLLERRLPLVYAPAAIVVHPVRPAPWGVSIPQQRKAVFNALLYRKHPRLYRERIQPHPPWRYYAVLALALAAALGVLVGQAALAAIGLAGWVAMTLAFSVQRLHRTSHAPSHVVEMVVTSAAIPVLAVFWRLLGAARFRVPFL